MNYISKWKEKCDTEINALKVYPNKNDVVGILSAAVIGIIIFSLIYKFNYKEIICLSIGCLLVSASVEFVASTHYLLTYEGMYVNRWLITSFYEWTSFREIYVENDANRGNVLVICFNRGIKRKGNNSFLISKYPFKFFAFEFKGQVSETTGKFQTGLPLVEKEQMVVFIERRGLNVQGLELLLDSMHNTNSE